MSCFPRRTGKWGMREAARPQNTVLFLSAPLLDATFPGMLLNRERLVYMCLLWTLHRKPELCALGAQSRMEGVSVDAGQRQWEWGLTRYGERMKIRGSGFPQAEDLGSGLWLTSEPHIKQWPVAWGSRSSTTRFAGWMLGLSESDVGGRGLGEFSSSQAPGWE